MPTVSDSSPSITPILLAGLVVLTFRHLRRLQIALPAVDAILETLAVARSRAYEVAAEIERAIADLARPVGRPPKVEAPVGPDRLHPITAQVRDFVMEHPGAVVPGPERRGYSDEFRRFIVDLCFEDLPLESFAHATGVPYETLRTWLRRPIAPPPTETAKDDGAAIERGRIAMILALWRPWTGDLLAFQRALAEQHALSVSLPMLREVLRIEGKRKTTSRGSKSSPEALRGTLERFFPGAQWVADGKTVDIVLGQTRHRFTWELVVDTCHGAHVGFDIRDAEDGEGVIHALDHAVATTDGTPCAVLLDNRPSNHTEDVADKIAEMDALKMSSTLFRAQNKASVEGAFGLFAQKMPPIWIDAPCERELARSVLRIVLFAYCAGRNQAPRDPHGKTAASLYLAANPSDEQREAACARLQEINTLIRERNQRDSRALHPASVALLEDAFQRLGLSDPEGHFVPAIAKYGIDAVVEAIAVLEQRLRDKIIDCPERYLLGIARNVADRNSFTARYERLLELRQWARDFAIKPLTAIDGERLNSLSQDAYVDITLRDAVDASKPIIHRAYFQLRFLDSFRHLGDPDEQQRRGRKAARAIAVSHSLPSNERSNFMARIAAKLAPLTTI